MHISVVIARFWTSNYLGMLCRILGWVKRDKRGEDMPQVFRQSHWIVCVRMCCTKRKNFFNEIRECNRCFLRMSSKHMKKKKCYIFLVHIQDTIQFAQCNKYRFWTMIPLSLFILILYITFIHSITFIQYCTFILSISSLLGSSVGKTSLGCRSENRTRAWLTASRRTTNWAAPQPESHFSPLELRRTLWATPHPMSHASPSEQRRTLIQ